ncbi:hypothetical protein EJD97_018981 [Solanum chilense]|uniref:Protein phosphatase 1 regulatory subunit 7 n=1 Tax=Solanum chilense TaxID=4083 RepID=A0A6N2B2F4_SOLCI|nr:hypothetical protein EJD97_018981 [Solanum chilense]
MAVLSSKQVLKDNNTTDPSSITSLTLTHKALSDVSCLSEFENLQKLDLGFNNLTSLEVLNAGKNKLKSMDEVSGLVNLRALILNDNDIVSICKLDKMKELNTLVLSRNPISGIGQSLAKINSITKLSLSNCQLQGVDSSLKSCTELKELRLAHNDIKTLPSELAFNVKLQNLDIGNNVIIKWSDLKVLSSLVNLKNLNLQGNPIAEKEDLAKKIKKQVPSLQILNAKPIEKAMKKEEGGRGDDENESGDLDIARVRDSKEERKLKKKKRNGPMEEGLDDHHEESAFLEKDKVKKSNKFSKNGKNVADIAETLLTYPDEQKESKLKNEKINEFDKASGRKRKELVQAGKTTNFDTGVPPIELDTGEEGKHKKQKSEALKEKASNVEDKEPAKKSSKKAKQNKASAIDDGETPFSDLFISDLSNPLTGNRKVSNHNTHQQNVDAAAGLATFPKKKKQKKNIVTGAAAVQFSSAIDEIGLGGASTWDD